MLRTETDPPIRDLHATGYMQSAVHREQRAAAIRKALRALRAFHKRVPFDALAFRGLSGGLLAPTLADRLGVDLLAVRKPGEKAHTSLRWEGYCGSKYVIVDDFISTGGTIKEIVTELERGGCQCVGFYTYCPNVGMQPGKDYVYHIETFKDRGTINLPAVNPKHDFEWR